jgi:hypothetical protein
MYRRDAPVHSDVNWRLLTCWKWLQSTWVKQSGKVKAHCRDAKDDKLLPAVISMKKNWRQDLTKRRLRGEPKDRKSGENARIERARECELERESEREEETTTTTTQSGGKSSRRRKWELQRKNPTGGPPKMSLMDVSHPRSHHFPAYNLSLESHGRLPGLAG